MPEMDGLQTLEALRELHPALPVLMLTVQDHRYTLNAFIDAGACAILLKMDTSIEEIRAALESSVRTGYYFNRHLNRETLTAVLHTTQRPGGFQKLTTREVDVLRYTCDGLYADEIGRKMHLSTRTVERIRVTLLRKTGAKTPINLVVFALQAGLYPATP